MPPKIRPDHLVQIDADLERLMGLVDLIQATIQEGGAPAVESGEDESRAEVVRLSAEMEKLAKRNAWKGVEKAYKEIEKLGFRGLSDPAFIHEMGSQAATTLGDTQARLIRLKRAGLAGGEESVEGALDHLEEEWGEVNIRPARPPETRQEKKDFAGPKLQLEQMPFAPDQRKALEAAMAQIEATGIYKGLLPLGAYTLGTESFVLAEGAQVDIEWGDDSGDSGSAAEAFRLAEEMRKLATRNAWSGVERAYGQIMEVGLKSLQNAGEVYFLGAQAARSDGKSQVMVQRIQKAMAAGYDRQECQNTLEEVERDYGAVVIVPGPDRGKKVKEGPELIAQAMPFNPTYRKAIIAAQQTLASTGSFKGLLPGGAYTVGDHQFTVEPGGKNSLSW
jgi:hypothetical protein